jgi:hypothetical protein
MPNPSLPPSLPFYCSMVTVAVTLNVADPGHFDSDVDLVLGKLRKKTRIADVLYMDPGPAFSKSYGS